jgi:hypothetical protein
MFTVTNSPVTGSGTLTGALASQTANTVLVAPNGSAGAPTFRLLAAADIPSLDAAKITTGTLPVARGGTGLTTVGTSGQVLSSNGTSLAWANAAGGTVSSVALSGGTTGLTVSGSPITSSGTITLAGTLAVANGGTGATTQAAAANAILPAQASNSGKVLSTDGTNVSWAAAAAANVVSNAQNNTKGGTSSLGVMTTSVSETTAFGYSALSLMTNGSGNTAIGSRALMNASTGSNYNVAVGSYAGNALTTGQENTAVGHYAMGGASSASATDNTAVGAWALKSVTASSNTGVGMNAGQNVTSGANNLVLGISSAQTLTTGSQNVVLGPSANVSAAAAANRIAIGYGASADTDNGAVIGNASLTQVDPGATDTANLGSATKRWKGLYALAVINAQTASYILAAADLNAFVTLDSTSALVLTVPLNTAVALPIGFQCTVAQKNTGTVTITPTAGVTIITTATTRALKSKGSGATLIKTGTDEWMLFGDLN